MTVADTIRVPTRTPMLKFGQLTAMTGKTGEKLDPQRQFLTIIIQGGLHQSGHDFSVRRAHHFASMYLMKMIKLVKIRIL